MNKQHKTKNNVSYPFKFNEGQRMVLCCNETSLRCPSLNLTTKEAQQKLIDKGFSREKIEEFTGFLRELAHIIIINELRNNTAYDDKP